MKRLLAIVLVSLSMGAFVLAARTWSHERAGGSWLLQSRERGKILEPKVAVTEIAWGVAQCAERTGEVPETTAKVPASLAAVAAEMYQSRLSDWNDVAYACGGFHMRRPQYFQYQWVRSANGAGGVVTANADLDGDGVVDHTVSLPVRCEKESGALRCRPDPMPTAPPGLSFTTEWLE